MTVPLYVHSGRHDLAAVLHEPDPDQRRDGAVLLCPPWGWEEVSSARTRMLWARRLAAVGLPVLRIDLPGCGDSSGTARDPGLLDAWVDAVGAAATWLQELDGVRNVAVIGLGLSGLLARAAIARGAPVEALVLWHAPADGRAALRRISAFARLSGLALEQDAGDGARNAGGFLLTRETADALTGLRAADQRPGALRRVLTLDEDTARASATDGLAEAGVEVESEPVPGWEAMTDHPEQSALPEAAVALTAEWLRRRTIRISTRPRVAARRVMALEGGAVEETAVRLRAPGADLAGVITRPASHAGGPWVVFLSAGAVRHVGPNRLWVHAARRLAAAHTTSVRVDLAGIGESGGERPEGPWATAEFYETDGDAQVAGVLAGLEDAGADAGFILVGLCAGGYWALRSGADPRVRTAVVVNPGAVVWDPRGAARDEVRRLARLRDPEWWVKLARGDVDLHAERLRSFGAAVLHGGARAPASGHEAALAAVFDRLHDAGTRLVLGFAEGEPVHEELWRAGILERLDDRPDVDLRTLPGGDHTLRPAEAQQAFCALIEAEAARLAAVVG